MGPDQHHVEVRTRHRLPLEGVGHAKILKDLAMYSQGRINLDPYTYLLHEFKEVQAPQQHQNKKKKRK